MTMDKQNIVEMARAGLLKEVEMKDDMTFTLESTIPRYSWKWTKHTIEPGSASYALLQFLTRIKNPGEIFNMFDLTKDESSRLYAIPKELYEEGSEVESEE